MKKSLCSKLSKQVCSVAISLIIMSSLAFGGRLDFGVWHETDFIEGNCKLKTKDYSQQNVTIWIVEFPDGCVAGWTSDLSGANQRHLRWLYKIEHGRIM